MAIFDIEQIDKLDGFKRYTLVVPMEIAFILACLILAYQGHTLEAIAAISGVFGTMIGYYFGKNVTTVQT
mgnify:CR=1 FL=1